MIKMQCRHTNLATIVITTHIFDISMKDVSVVCLLWSLNGNCNIIAIGVLETMGKYVCTGVHNGCIVTAFVSVPVFAQAC